MTENTVPVPVELLKRVEAEVYYGSESPLKELRGYIPVPSKVGDVVTAESVKSLPAGTVLRDVTDDIWLIGPQARLSYINPARADPRVFILSDPAWDVYEPAIISLPEESK